MAEARRFIRYLMPSLVFVVEIVLYFFVSAPKRLIELPSTAYFHPLKDNIWILSGAILAFGGLGYFFSIIYHAFFKWLRWSDHLPLLKDAINNEWIKLYHRDNGNEFNSNDIKKIKKNDAWCILSAYYHVRIHKEEFKKAHERIESLNDTMHSLGTTMVGSIFAFLIWAFFHYVINEPFFLYHFIFPILVTSIMIHNYLGTAKEANHFADNIVSEFMMKESRARPVKMHVSLI